ncbi:ParB/RepB/Spo0J family partition protein [Hephaestia sp. GCM10023244]|uniref:ParB/RepB/Spo0J family partition protein n=1 Tax=unclassified Hephaestia TaxID=2631281 RepID=UPI002076FDC7|nr:ParB N-terminal domain-containing protein [Hephaestia sp. MAHUQ-44]MCM8732433.1 ParB N-terminal domain-containing protein [Hephaestia sp. MAHUQ-44]
MKLDFIPLDRLSVGKTNMRTARKAPDVADLLPTVRKRGVLQPIIVRPDGADRYEIVAGLRRFTAATLVADERRESDEDAACEIAMMPCAILDAGDDVDAIEASLIENVARRDADEVTLWETFTRLVKEGRSVDDIAGTFGLPELAVKRVLALGNLLPAIRRMYAREEIDRAAVRHLTLASKRQQQAWLALAKDDNADCPTGHQLKAWLFGGQSIAVEHALFDVAASGLVVIADLFGDERYFADAEAFWSAQDAAIEAKRAGYIDVGWADAIVVGPSDHFASWDYEKTPKRKGGRVYLDVRASGEVVVHEGYVGRKEAARLARGEAEGAREKPARPECTSKMQTYIDLHRHAAVRAALTGHPGVAFRLMVAHAIAGSLLWSVRCEPQTARSDAIGESVESGRAEAAFDERRRAVLALLDVDPDTPTVTRGNADPYKLVALFLRLLDLPDAAVMEVVAIVMGETLASGSAAVEAVGLHIGVDMARYWQADEAFFALIRDRKVMTRIVAEVAGEAVAEANAKEKIATMKTIVRDHLDGTNGRAQAVPWVPRWMAFPPSAYTVRGGVGTVGANALVAAAKLPEPDGEGGPDAFPPAAPAIRPPTDANGEPVLLAA